MSPELIVALVLGGVVVLLTLMILQVYRKDRRAMDAARRLLPNHTTEPLGHRFAGQVHGVEVALRLANRHVSPDGDPLNRGPFAEVHLPSPPGVSLELRTQNPTETRLVSRGLASDVAVGDPAFDAAFIVEMAPAHLAHALFDADLRRRLLELRPVEVFSKKEGGLRLDKRNWDEDRFSALIEAGAMLAARLHQVAGADVAWAQWAGSPGPPQRTPEQADLDAMRAARRSYELRRTKIMVVVVVVGLLVILVLRLLLS